MDGTTAAITALIFIIYVHNVNAALNVHTYPDTVLRPVNSEVTVDCIPTPKKNVRITWENDKKTIPLYPAAGKITGNIYVFANNSLYIRSLKRRNTGTYMCIGSSGAERQYATVTVKVTFLQKFDGMDPVRVFEGSSEARIVCNPPHGVPPPNPSWKKNGKALNDSRISTDSWTLTIRNVQKEDAGNYTCYATNRAKQRNVTAPLEVVIPGKIYVKPKNDQIKENQESSFQCISKSIPPLDVTWKKVEKVCSTKPCKYSDKKVVVNDRIKISDGKLVIKKAQPADKGIYKCVATLNSEYLSSNVTLNVVELIKIDPTLHREIQRKDLRKKRYAKITCQFRGDGLFQVKWSKMEFNTKDLPDKMKGNHTTLIINNLKYEDAGNYTCTAKGEFNTAIGHVQLEVYESPVFVVKPQNTTGYVGEPAWIHCKGTGRPAPSVNYLRSKDTKTLRMKAPLNESRFETLPNHTLYIKELKMEDDGPYFCWLTQKHFSISSDFYLNVREPMQKTESGTPMARTVGIAVGCAGVYILLVIGLMIYCRARRARLLKKEGEDGECLKDPLVGNEDIPLQNGKCLDQWQFPREELKESATLGRGKMGRIFKAKAYNVGDDCSEMLVAVKEFDGKIEEYKSDFDLEVEMFAQLNHDNVVRLIGVTTDTHPYYIITDYSELGDMKMYITNHKHISCTTRLNMSFCIVSGMDYLIKRHYIHRDLAARNCIPYPDNNVKVSFLSICEDLYRDDYYLLNNIPVPLRWLSPEAIQSESYSEKSDVWSFGVTMWEIFSGGKGPYSDYKNEKVLDGVCKDLRLPIPDGCPEIVYDVMKKCWLHDVNQRPSFEELTSLLAEINIPE